MLTNFFMMEALLINFMFTRFINSKFRSVQKKICKLAK